MGIVFVPVYLHYIGVEGYGLVGFFTMISAVLMILDGGFGSAASRELAKAHTADKEARLSDLIRTLEWIFWGLALLLGIGLILLAPWVANSWLNVQQMKSSVATDAVRLMGAALILQWPTAFYRGCIIGLQRQIGLNTISACMATARGAGGVIVLWGIAPTIRAFFAWQVVAAFLNVFALRRFLWHAMPTRVEGPQFRMNSVREVGSFAAAVGSTNVLSLVLTQLDKVILSKVLPLTLFGDYTLAATISSLIFQFIGPVFNAFYPRITQVVSNGREREIAPLYHRACETMALSVVPISMLMIFFGRDIVWIWTHNARLADDISIVVACLAVGTMFNGLMTIPYALQLANAWTMFAFWQNIIAVCLLAPLTYFLATRFGLIGAAAVWPLLNLGYVIFSAPIMYRRLLRAEMRHWYTYSVVIPIVASATVMSLAKVVVNATNMNSSTILLAATLVSFLIVCFPLSGWLMPELRSRLRGALKVNA
jgi:O-antigen/teichoic acid export membrane protein